MDRVPGFEPEGWGFDSLRGRTDLKKEVLNMVKTKRNTSRISAGSARGTQGFKDRPLGAYPDSKKHEVVESPQEKGEQSAVGSMPKSGSDEVADVEKIAESMGIYEGTNPKSTEEQDGPENPAEVNIAEEIKKNNEG